MLILTRRNAEVFELPDEMRKSDEKIKRTAPERYLEKFQLTLVIVSHVILFESVILFKSVILYFQTPLYPVILFKRVIPLKSVIVF